MASSSGSGRSMLAQVCCREHPDAILVEDFHAGDLICPMCGLVVGDRVIDVGSEWRTFSNEKDSKDNSRVGAAENPLLDGGDMSTMIATGTASEAMKDEFGKALYKNRRAVSSSDRTLFTAYREIAQMADRWNLPKIVIDRANVLFKQVHDSKSLRGRSTDAIVSACTYIACRQEDVPRTFKEICAVSKVRKKEIGRVFNLIIRNLGTQLNQISTGDFMSRFCSNLSLSTAIQKAATLIATRAVDLDLVPGRSPVSVAAAAIYMASQASNDKKTAKEIGEIAGAAEVTIRQSYKAILPKASELFPADFEFSTSIKNLPRN